MKPFFAIILTLALGGVICSAIDCGPVTGASQSQPAVIFQPGAIVVNIVVPAGAIPVNAPVTLTVDPTIYIQGHLLGETRPATETKP